MCLCYRDGDVTQPKGDGQKLIPHVCNDIGGWGKGFVLAISKRWKEPEEEYRKWYLQCKSRMGYRFMPMGEVQYVRVEEDIVIANMIAQHLIWPMGGIAPVRYRSLTKTLANVCEYARENDASVHMPRIASELAGGDWAIIESIIVKELVDYGVSTTVYTLPSTD